MKKDVAIKLENVSKNYKIYDRARDRLKEAFNPFRRKYYKEFCAVENINLEVKKGEVLGIFGLNGAGKSTLLKIIAGVVTPTTGNVHINGHINAMLELTGSLNPELTGEQNIKFNLNFNDVPDVKRPQIIKDIVDFAGVGQYINQPVKNYSSGMAARLGFGIATATKPEILIIDEVLAVGDAVFQNKCFMKIRQLLREGTTVIFVSHNVPLMVEFCTRSIFLHERNIILDDEPRMVAHYYQRALFSTDKTRVIQEMKVISGIIDEKELSSIVSEDDVSDNLEIFRLRILDDDGLETSFLETGNKYKLSFDICFKNSYKRVKVDYIAKDITGKPLPLFGSESNNDIIKNVEVSSSYNITNTFKCDVYKGQYSIEVGLIDVSDECSCCRIESPRIEIKFEAGIVNKENIIKIQKI